jgi:putative component of membrane protein insertase Oxa1/YidC/SpoIIIJ protein YidD
MRLINKLLIFIILGTRPLLGPPARCRYAVTCTHFAIAELQTTPLHKALWSILKRILSCNPFYL